jgi:hypothetical protein
MFARGRALILDATEGLEIGILTASLQAAFSVAATSSFTKAGWQWIESLFSRIHIRSHSPSRLRSLLSALLFAVICPTWIWAPSGLAVYYNNRGLALEHTNPPQALAYLERSVTGVFGLVATANRESCNPFADTRVGMKFHSALSKGAVCEVMLSH